MTEVTAQMRDGNREVRIAGTLEAPDGFPAASIGGVTVSGTPTAGDLLTAHDATSATWVAGGGGGAPTGPAGGSLAGTYPNPSLAAGAVGGTELATGAVTAVKIAAGTITDTQVATANKDGTAGTASLRTLGTGSTQACAGNDSRLSDSRAPSGSAGGDLTGSYPNPTIGAGKVGTTALADLGVTNGKIANGTVAIGKLAFTPVSQGDAAGGDLAGTYPSPTVAKLQGAVILSGTPSGGQVLTASDATHASWATPGGGGGAMTQLFDSTLGSDAASFDVSSISGSYTALMLSLMLRGTASAFNCQPRLRLNNDTGTHYSWSAQYTTEAGGGPGVLAGSAETSVRIGFCPAASANSSAAATFTIQLPNYAGSTFWQALSSIGQASAVDGSGNAYAFNVGGSWETTAAAVTRVTIFPDSGNWKAGSRCTIWGIL